MKNSKIIIIIVLFLLIILSVLSSIKKHIIANDSENLSSEDYFKYETFKDLPKGYINLWDFLDDNELYISINLLYPNNYIVDVDGAVLREYLVGDLNIIEKETSPKYKKYAYDLYIKESETLEIIKEAKEKLEEKIKIYNLGEKIFKKIYDISADTYALKYSNDDSIYSAIVDSVEYTNKYNGEMAKEYKKLFIVKLKEYNFQMESRENFIYEIFSKKGERYTQYYYNPNDMSYCFEIDEEEEIEFVNIHCTQDRKAGEKFKRSINIIKNEAERTISNKFECMEVDEIKENYISMSEFKKEYSEYIFFEEHLPYVYVNDTKNNSAVDKFIINNGTFVKSKENQMIYINKDYIENILSKINIV